MGAKKKGPALILAGFYMLGPGLSAPGAMDWPLAEGTAAANFGLNDQGRPCLGMVFQSEGPVLAADGGELIFHRGQEDAASRLPSPLGSWIVYDHGDGILGIYSRFDEGKGDSPSDAGEAAPAETGDGGPAAADAAPPAVLLPREIPVRPRRGELIALSGLSGWSEQKGFYFALYDRRERRWVNPSLVIVPFPDDRPPEILSVQLQSDNGRLIPPAQTRIGQGRYSIIVYAVDSPSRASPVRLAPHRLSVFLNGAEAGSLSMETFSAQDGILSVRRDGLTPVSEVYAPHPAYKAGDALFTRGQTTMEIIARDVRGNEAGLTRRLEVE
ncbi:MAG: hypothetical protein LBH51_08535 [Treponema sp.]|jgi:hypothetical protein|nr:hypothetical protein [Treponema sp.]